MHGVPLKVGLFAEGFTLAACSKSIQKASLPQICLMVFGFSLLPQAVRRDFAALTEMTINAVCFSLPRIACWSSLYTVRTLAEQMPTARRRADIAESGAEQLFCLCDVLVFEAAALRLLNLHHSCDSRSIRTRFDIICKDSSVRKKSIAAFCTTNSVNGVEYPISVKWEVLLNRRRDC
jgi:hypothetical protein